MNGAETTAERGYRLLDEAGSFGGVTVRDDHYDFAWLLDAARLARRRGRRFRLVDSGRFAVDGLEWLAAAGADIYTGDDVRPGAEPSILIRKAAERASAVVAFFHHGPLEEDVSGFDRNGEILAELLRSGVDVHLSNRERRRSMAALKSIGASRKPRGAYLVYYHHGPILPEIKDAAETGAWIHCRGDAFDSKTDSLSIEEIGRAAVRAGSGLIVHVDDRFDGRSAEDLRAAGATILRTYRSSNPGVSGPMPFRAFYLDATFLL